MIRFAKVSLLLALSLAGCGSGGSGSTGAATSGVTETKHIPTLTAAEKGTLCDWFAAQIGGYAATSSCAQPRIDAPTSQSECEAGLPACDATVSDFETCAKAMIAAQTTCTDAAFNSAAATPACVAAGICFSAA